jgi:hypothetical protein
MPLEEEEAKQVDIGLSCASAHWARMPVFPTTAEQVTNQRYLLGRKLTGRTWKVLSPSSASSMNAVPPYDRVNGDGGGSTSLRCERHDGVSRHRYMYASPLMPEGFWNIGFESEM